MRTNFNLNELKQFCGSEQFFKHSINRKLIYTEGIQYLAKNARCYWFIDEIAVILLPSLLKNRYDEFYSIQLLVTDCSAVITVGDGNGNTHMKHKIEWTDFPISGIPVDFYLCASGEHYCLMLTNEY
jgi:hypothetical protein